jgi:hypothetical protein
VGAGAAKGQAALQDNPLPNKTPSTHPTTHRPGRSLTCLQAAPADPDITEPTSLSTQAGECAYFYSRHLTPAIVSFAPTSVTNVTATPNLTICGSRMAHSATAAAHTVTVGGVACADLTLLNSTCIVCTLPALPAGTAALAVSVAGRGTAWLGTTSQSVGYALGGTSPTPSSTAFWGGEWLGFSTKSLHHRATARHPTRPMAGRARLLPPDAPACWGRLAGWLQAASCASTAGASAPPRPRPPPP